ncbi:MAG TPA: DUF72 domain-containing protein [Chthoniobacterales bacterium]|nr:DUF72 domain-containing protein [Chthoniobacterales bacterium]
MGKKGQSESKILVGTASWSDPGFVEHWYPKKMPAGERLGWYAQHFEMVEVNSSFYSVPDPRLVERWAYTTPSDFVFDVKLHQLLSRHSTNLKLLPPALQKNAETDAKGRVKLTPKLEAAMVDELRRPLEILRGNGKLGALLLQLSPGFSPKKHQLSELDDLLGALADYRIAIELRNRNWVEGENLEPALEFFRGHSATLVSVDAPKEKHFMIMPPDLDAITNPKLAYLRLHGRDVHAYTTGKTVAARFNYDYSDDEIDEVANRARDLATEAKEVHVVFNNNALDYAPHAAARMRKALGQMIPPTPRQTELF